MQLAQASLSARRPVSVRRAFQGTVGVVTRDVINELGRAYLDVKVQVGKGGGEEGTQVLSTDSQVATS